MQQSKACTKCKLVKPLSEYSKHKAFKSGIRSSCKACEKKDAQRYAATEHGKTQIAARRKAWRAKSADKIAVHNRNYRLKNPEKLKQKGKNYWEKNRPMLLAKQKKYREANADKVALSTSKWQKENKDRVNAKSKKWRNTHPEQAAQIGKNFREKNPENGKLTSMRYRARKYQNGIFLVRETEIKSLLEKPCFYCGAKSEHLDHVTPISRGGRHSIGNLIQSCAGCNLSKSKKTIMEWRVAKVKMVRFSQGAGIDSTSGKADEESDLDWGANPHSSTPGYTSGAKVKT
jgi:5-methylcytosine-specific restriction endonuclease McrA